LSREERIDELAAMLDGTPVSEHSRASAREIIERAHAMLLPTTIRLFALRTYRKLQLLLIPIMLLAKP
jgi:hypothetical protein